jgi:hypothetical protein
MGYNGEDKWEMYGKEFSTSVRTLSELKSLLIKHLESFDVNKATSSIKSEDYKITNIRFSIKRISK